MSVLKVFVYGTLKPGYDNHNRYCRDRLLQTQSAKVRGDLYAFSVGYPGMTHGKQWVQGFLLTLQEDGMTLKELDRLEDYAADDPTSLYQREMTDIFTPDGDLLGQAWVYFMTLNTVQSMGGIPVPSGNWS